MAQGPVEAPYWWDAAPRPKLAVESLPPTADVAIVGSGYTGLSAALDLRRARKSVAVIDAEAPGAGASSRNTGSIGRTFRHSFASLLKSLGAERAIALYKEVAAAFEYSVNLIEANKIECYFKRSGRFTGAVTPRHYDNFAKELDIRSKHLPTKEILLPAARQREEIGFGEYHGGMVIPDVGSIHPGLYHLGLLKCVLDAGATIVPHTRVESIQRSQNGFLLSTNRGQLRAREVIVATNGYTGKEFRHFQRRVIPFPGFIAATEPLSEQVIRDVLPGGRVFQESKNNPFYMRISPDGTRFLFGGLTGSSTHDLSVMATRLHGELTKKVPKLAAAKVSHIWTGNCAATFNVYPQIGVHEGIHFAMGYCFAGISMGTYLGHKIAQRLLGSPDGATAFDSVPAETRLYHWGEPWFLPLIVALFNWRDRRDAKASVFSR